MNQAFQFSHREDTTTVGMTVGDIVRGLRTECKYFIHFFLAEELTLEIPDFHVTSWDLLTAAEIMKVALALPRGHAKSTLTKLACLWYLLFTPTRFILYASNTSEIAAAAVVDIMSYIKSDNFRAVFGVPTFHVERENQGFYKFDLQVPLDETASSWHTKTCILKSIGTGKQVRGMLIDNQRPQLLVADDVEDEDNTSSDIQQKKVIKWIMGPFYKAADKKWAKFIFIGNMLSNKCFLYQITLMEDWHSMRMGCIKADGTPLWPELWPLSEIQKDFVTYQKLGLTSLWFAEMMNMPMAEADGLIKGDEIKYRAIINPNERQAAFITIDPAVSEKTWADKTGVVVHVLYNDCWQIAEYMEERMQPERLFFIVLELCFRWRTRVVGIEIAGYQKVLKILFEVLMLMHKQTFEVFEVPHRNRPKTERLMAFCALLRQGTWLLNEGDFAVVEQLLSYDPTKKNNQDDLIDACAQGPTMYNMYLPIIMQSYEIAGETMVKSGYAIAQL